MQKGEINLLYDGIKYLEKKKDAREVDDLNHGSDLRKSVNCEDIRKEGS